MFDNVYAIHWKDSSLAHIRELVPYLKSSGYQVRFYTPDTELTEYVDFDYIERYFGGRDSDFPSLEIKIDALKFDCFLECKSTISFWFNDSSDAEVNEDRLRLIKSTMRELALRFERTVYFVNEGESTHRYKIFKITKNGLETDYDLSDISKCAEEVA